MLAMALGMSLTALSVAPVGTTGIGNVAVSAMSGQGGGRMEMDMSGGPGMAGDGVGEPDATCATTGVGTNPPLDNPRSSPSGGRSKVKAWGNNEASAGPSGEPFEAGDSGSNDKVVAMHTTAGVETSPPPDKPEISSSGRRGKGGITGGASASESSKGRNAGGEEGGVLSVDFRPAGISIGN